MIGIDVRRCGKYYVKDYPRYAKTLGDRIKKKRLDLGLSQRQMAEKIGVSRRALIKWEKGRYKPRKENLDRMISLQVKV